MSWGTRTAVSNGIRTAAGGGSFFVFYRGLSFLLDIGRWGFKLGWYG